MTSNTVRMNPMNTPARNPIMPPFKHVQPELDCLSDCSNACLVESDSAKWARSRLSVLMVRS